MILSSILSYFFIMLVLYVCANSAAHTYRVNVNKGNNPTFFSAGVVFFIFFFTIAFAIRYNVGVDYAGYLENYESGYKLEYSKNEFLYQQIALFLYDIGAHPIFFFGVYVFIQISFFLASFKNEIYLLPFFVIFMFGNGEVINWMNIVRSSTAMCIWLFSIQYIEKRKFWVYLSFCLLASGFHRVALLYIMFYPILARNTIKTPPTIIQIIVLISALVVRVSLDSFSGYIAPFVSFIQFLFGGDEGFYKNYDFDGMVAEANQTSSGTGMAFIVKLVLDVVIIFKSSKMITFYSSKRFNMMYFLFVIALFFFYCFPASVISLSRPFRFLFIFRTIMLAYFSYFLWKNRSVGNNKLFLQIFIMFYISFFIGAQMTSNVDSTGLYQTWFNIFKKI